MVALKLFLLLLYVFAGAAIAWPRTAARTQVQYAADGNGQIYHKRVAIPMRECEYEPMVRFKSERDAKAHGLRPCPKCFPNNNS